MKILLLVDDYLPASIKVAAIMMHHLAKELQSQGHEVTVCTPDETLVDKYFVEEYEGVRVLRFKAGAIKNVSKIRRAINETLLSFLAWRSLKEHFVADQFDLIVFYSPTIFFGHLVKRLKKLWSCASYLILRDIFPQWAVDNGLIKDGSLVHRYFKYFESVNYAAADVIAVQSPSNEQYFKNNKQYVRHINKLDVLYNWSDLASHVKSSGLYRKKLGLVDKVVFFYGGNIGHAQDMMNIVRLAQSLIDYPVAHFLLVGKGDEVELILKAINDYKIKNITYLNSISQHEYQKMLAEFDVGLFSLHRCHKTHNFPGKLLGYMKYSMPILGSVNRGNDLEIILADAEAGFVTINGDDRVFTENAIKLIESAALRRKIGENAYKLLNDNFSVKIAASKVTALCR